SALFYPLLLDSGSPPVAFARTDNLGRPIPRRHLLTLIVSFFRHPDACAPADEKRRRAVCACTLYPVFKEPTVRAPVAPSPVKRFSAAWPTAFRGTLRGYRKHPPLSTLNRSNWRILWRVKTLER